MKNIYFALVACICFFLIIYSCTKTVTEIKTVTVTDTVTNTILDSNIHLENGLVAYYPFNGNVNDSGANQLNGAIFGGIGYSTDILGNTSGAVAFDGSTSYIKVADPTGKFQSDALSISFLVNLTDNSQNQVLITDVDFVDGSGQGYAAAINATGLVQKMQFGVVTNSTNCSIPFYDAGAVVNSANIIAINQWYHITCVFVNGLQQIYVNGILNTAMTRNFTTINKCANNSLIIGGFWQGDLKVAHGSMDELRIYNRALNQNEITTLARVVN